MCLQRELGKIREIWEIEYPSETFLFKGGLILTILNDPHDKAISEEELRDKTADLISLLARDLNTSFSAVFDPIPASLSDAALNLSDLEDAAENRLIFGPGSCIDMKRIRKRKSLEFEVTKQEEDKLSAALNRQDFEKAARVCFGVLDRAADRTHRSVRNASIRLISVINDAMNRFSSYSPSRSLVSFSALLRDANNCASIKELKDFFISFLNTINNSLNTGLDGRRNEIVLAVKRIIKNKYSNPNLSSVLISEELGLSAPYSGRVFKEATGNSLPDFINEFRTERAKELLLTTDLSIQIILEKTGYNSTSHFYSVFRKLNGLTPTAYRWKHKSSAQAAAE
jgi:YesN/AraC family two-component response regulator